MSSRAIGVLVVLASTCAGCDGAPLAIAIVAVFALGLLRGVFSQE